MVPAAGRNQSFGERNSQWLSNGRKKDGVQRCAVLFDEMKRLHMQYIWSEQGQLPVQAQRIRRDVFMQEQGFCDEFDAFDKKSWHVLLQTNGKTHESLAYDTNEITALLFTEAEAKRKAAAGLKNVTITPAVEFDFGLHLYLGFASIIAKNPECDFTDLERLHGTDLIDIMAVGRNFLLKSEDATPSNSDEPSETTPKPTTPQ